MFATGITVVTTRTPAGEPIGLTVNSFNSVSLDPPLIVWSLANELPSRALFEGCEYYAINVLAEDQADLSQRFASRLGEKFAGPGVRLGDRRRAAARRAAARASSAATPCAMRAATTWCSSARWSISTAPKSARR